METPKLHWFLALYSLSSLAGCAVATSGPYPDEDGELSSSDAGSRSLASEVSPGTEGSPELVGTQSDDAITGGASSGGGPAEAEPGSASGEGAGAGGTSTGGSASGGSSSGGTASGGAASGGSGGAPSCSGTSVDLRDDSKCGDTFAFEGALYECISQASGVNGETSGCGTTGVYCSAIDPADSTWGETAWSKVADCP